MQYLEEARVGFQPLDRFQQVIGDERMQQAMSVVREIRRRLARRVFWNVNSTAVGGGVAEMLQSLLGYARASGIDRAAPSTTLMATSVSRPRLRARSTRPKPPLPSSSTIS